MVHAIPIALFLVLMPCVAFADDLLTGDTRLACEAILCLSSPNQPGECGPSLDRYFGIKKKKASDTRKARRNFLKMCPDSDADAAMASLTDSISQAAGQCDVDTLNARGEWEESRKDVDVAECRQGKEVHEAKYSVSYQEYSSDSGYIERCERVIRYWQVNTEAPGYCRNLWNHTYTDFKNGPHVQQGQYPWETKWVE